MTVCGSHARHSKDFSGVVFVEALKTPSGRRKTRLTAQTLHCTEFSEVEPEAPVTLDIDQRDQRTVAGQTDAFNSFYDQIAWVKGYWLRVGYRKSLHPSIAMVIHQKFSEPGTI